LQCGFRVGVAVRGGVDCRENEDCWIKDELVSRSDHLELAETMPEFAHLNLQLWSERILKK
jgi:hypothetical protein